MDLWYLTFPELRVEDDRLVMVKGKETRWAIPVDTIHVVGEYTTDQGPGLEDQFYWIAAGDPVHWYTVGFEIAPSDLFRTLSGFLGAPLCHGLNNRTDYASRIAWPPALAEKPLFRYHQVKRGDGVVGRMLDWLLPNDTTSEITDEVWEYLKTCGHVDDEPEKERGA